MRNKILIIEDEELIREELMTLLSNAGYTTNNLNKFDKKIPPFGGFSKI